MMLVIQVGEVEQMKKVPKDYPRCGSYVPSMTVESNEKGSSSTNKPLFSLHIYFVLCIFIFLLL